MSKEEKIAKDFIDEEFSKAMKVNLEAGLAIDKKTLLEYVLKSKSWNDTIIYERMKSGSQILKNRDAVCKAFTEEIKKLKKSSNFQSWHDTTLKRLGNEFFEKNIGLAQKYLNMSIKYLYFLEVAYKINLIDNLSLEWFKNDFDIPIDSFILKWVLFNSVGDEEIEAKAEKISSWNKMQNDIYPFLQEKTKKLLNERYCENSSILVAETIVWGGIKKLKSKICMDL
jgi:hypothetical protein